MNRFAIGAILFILVSIIYVFLKQSIPTENVLTATPAPAESVATPQTQNNHGHEHSHDDHAETFTREEVAHDFGTEPNKVFYPSKAIDTDEAPSIAIAEDAKPDEPLHYYEVAPGTYFLFGNIAEVDENNRGWNGNAGFVVTEDGVVVIDALGTPKLGNRMIATIKSVTDKPITHVIVTHNHPDHAYGAIAFKENTDAQIIGHIGTMKYIESDRIEHSVAYRNTFIKSDMQGFKPVAPDVKVAGDLYSKYTFKSGGKTFDVYNTGSHHSYGDLIVNQVEDKVLWISDLAFNNRVTFMADGSSQKGIDAQTWLLENFADTKLMIPGHGSVQTNPFPMVTQTRAYMQHLRDAMTKAFDEDIELQEAVDNTEFDDWKTMNMYNLNHKKNVDFVYRELEEELF